MYDTNQVYSEASTCKNIDERHWLNNMFNFRYIIWNPVNLNTLRNF